MKLKTYNAIPANLKAIQKAGSSPLVAFHGSQKLKDFYVGRIQAHKEADEIVHRDYWVNGKGCAVGCTIHSGRHADYESELGIPRSLARLEDGIFESMPNGNSMEWPLRFINAIPVSANLYPALWRFMEWLLVDPENGVIRFAKKPKTRAVIQAVADLYRRQIGGEKITEKDWRTAAAAAYATADATARRTNLAFRRTSDRHAGGFVGLTGKTCRCQSVSSTSRK